MKGWFAFHSLLRCVQKHDVVIGKVWQKFAKILLVACSMVRLIELNLEEQRSRRGGGGRCVQKVAWFE